MTIRYIYSGSSQDDADSTWNSSTISYLTENLAYAAYVAGDEFYEAHDHNESGGGANITLTDSAAATHKQRMPVYRVNRSTGVYSPTTGVDTIQLDTSDGSFDIQHDINAVHYGKNFKIGDDFRVTTANVSNAELVNCYLTFTSSAGRLTVGGSNSDSPVLIKNTTIDFTHANGGQVFNSGARIDFEGVVFKGSPNANGFLTGANSVNKTWNFTGCDFSDWPSSETFIDASALTDSVWHCRVMNCLMPATLTWTDGVFDNDHQILEVFNSDADGNLYVSHKENLRGTISEDTAAYVNDGYVDADGDTDLSMKMEARAATTEPHSPLESLPFLARVDSTGSKTIEVECFENFTTALTKRQAWMELYYLGSATETLWTLDDSSREKVAASYTDLSAGTGLGNITGEPAGSRSVKLSATVTVNQTGLYMVKVFLGAYESGKVFHYTPKATVS